MCATVSTALLMSSIACDCPNPNDDIGVIANVGLATFHATGWVIIGNTMVAGAMDVSGAVWMISNHLASCSGRSLVTRVEINVDTCNGMFEAVVDAMVVCHLGAVLVIAIVLLLVTLGNWIALAMARAPDVSGEGTELAPANPLPASG